MWRHTPEVQVRPQHIPCIRAQTHSHRASIDYCLLHIFQILFYYHKCDFRKRSPSESGRVKRDFRSNSDTCSSAAHTDTQPSQKNISFRVVHIFCLVILVYLKFASPIGSTISFHTSMNQLFLLKSEQPAIKYINSSEKLP